MKSGRSGNEKEDQEWLAGPVRASGVYRRVENQGLTGRFSDGLVWLAEGASDSRNRHVKQSQGGEEWNSVDG